MDALKAICVAAERALGRMRCFLRTSSLKGLPEKDSGPEGHRPAAGPGIWHGHLRHGEKVINSGADDFPERSHLIQTQDAKCGHGRNSAAKKAKTVVA